MKISEIADLMTIRSHISSSVNNSNIDKSKIRPLLDLQTDIDHAIVDGVLDEDFKSSLNRPVKLKKETKVEVKSGLVKS